MEINHIGKFEMREIIKEFDSALISLYGANMLDASISRQDALNAYSEVHCPRKAAELCAERRGLARLSA